MIQTHRSRPATGTHQKTDDRESLCLVILKDISHLKHFSNRGLWALSLFLLVSTLAWHDFPFLPMPDTVVAALGPAPPAQMISVMLVIYTFSAIMLSLSRMMGGIEHHSSFCHVGYLSAFFLFYHFAKALDDNYWAVFGAGTTILAVESYRIWSFCSEKIVKKMEDLEYVRKTGRMPIDD
jgi:hypothetical protein